MLKIKSRVAINVLIIAILMAGYAGITIYGNEGSYGKSITIQTSDKEEAGQEPAAMGVPISPGETGKQESHVVFAELGSVSWCPNCPRASEKMSDLFSMDLASSFYYVTLVYDLNTIAAKRGRQLSNAYIPMLYLDGGYQIIDDSNNYASAIDTVSSREVHQLTMDLSTHWRGDAVLDIRVSITNEGSETYFGHLRVQVTEINSRWNNYNGDPFHYALLDYALNKYIRISSGDTYVETATWKGSDSHGGQTYGDITQDNIMIIGTVSHWRPHLQENPWTDPRPYRFFAQYVDETQASLPQ